MSTALTHTQTRSSPSPGVYRVVDTASSATGIPLQVFVYDASSALFSHVATYYDIVNYPPDRTTAQDEEKDYYRSETVTRSYTSPHEASEFATMLNYRIKDLVAAYDKVANDFVGSDTLTVVP